MFDLDALVITDPVSGTPIVLPRGPPPRPSTPEPRRSPDASTANTIRFFRAPVTAITDLTPSFRRFTFGGGDLGRLRRPGFDQRVKVVFPTDTLGLDAMPSGDDWYTAVARDARGPSARRSGPTRRAWSATTIARWTSTWSSHDVQGPASAWIARAAVGDEVLILAPTTAHTGVSYGIDFVPPARTDAAPARGRRDGGARHRGDPRAAACRGARCRRARSAASPTTPLTCPTIQGSSTG